MTIYQLDLTGLKCPMPIVRLSQHVNTLEEGEEFEAFADDPAFCLDVQAWCHATGHKLVSQESSHARQSAVIQKKQNETE